MRLIDTHGHLTDERLACKVAEVLDVARSAGVERVITVGTDLADSIAALELARKYEGLYCTVGIHPHEAKDADDSQIATLAGLTDDAKVVAIGEMGLDYHYDFSPRDKQQEIFGKQLVMAKEKGLPAVIHCREAFDDCFAVLDEFLGGNSMVFHCFAGDKDIVKKVLDRGGWISFSGTVTFKNAIELQEAAKYVPLDRIMVETDCPYLSPMPKRNVKPNHPGLMVHTAEKVAELKGVTFADFCQVATDNSRRFFGIEF
ncbi:MAG: TatD family hydrolase [Phycisphaerae bacterium]|nr:TatD family hydrolase [Phycisphaerae bacterium]